MPTTSTLPTTPETDMPFYTNIDRLEKNAKGQGARVAKNLLKLKLLFEEGQGLPTDDDYIAPVPEKSLEDNLLLASWNIREFDSPSFGLRSDEAMHYIAEIIARFDLVAVQEIRRDLGVLKRLKRLIGSHWDFIVTDETFGQQGNKERLAFLFDTRKIKFTGLTGEVVIPDGQKQLARTPFLAGFQAGWFKFTLCTVHILYGKNKANDPARVHEIKTIANHLATKMQEYKVLSEKKLISRSEYENVILLGDFNIFSVEDETYQALVEAGFDVSEQLIGKKTNAGKKKMVFDQIAYIKDSKNVQSTGNAGVINFFNTVYTEADQATYVPEIKSYIKERKGVPYDERTEARQKTYYKTYWRTHMMSDHYPIWVELKTNFSSEYLERRAFK